MEASKRFWETASSGLKARALEQVQKQIETATEVDRVWEEMMQESRLAFQPASVDFVQALYARVKPIFRAIEDFDRHGIDGYETKLVALMDPESSLRPFA